jgi:hypothetical protein
MSRKSGRPAGRIMAPRKGSVTQDGAHEIVRQLEFLKGEVDALRDKMHKRKIPQVAFDGANVMPRIFADIKKFCADFEYAIKMDEIRYPGLAE